MSDMGEQSSLPIMLIIAPATGKLKILPPQSFREGQEWVEPGQPVAEIVHSNGDADQVVAPRRGRLGGMMGRDGEPVRQGQPVAWMEAIPEDKSHIKPVPDVGA